MQKVLAWNERHRPKFNEEITQTRWMHQQQYLVLPHCITNLLLYAWKTMSITLKRKKTVVNDMRSRTCGKCFVSYLRTACIQVKCNARKKKVSIIIQRRARKKCITRERTTQVHLIFFPQTYRKTALRCRQWDNKLMVHTNTKRKVWN